MRFDTGEWTMNSSAGASNYRRGSVKGEKVGAFSTSVPMVWRTFLKIRIARKYFNWLEVSDSILWCLNIICKQSWDHVGVRDEHMVLFWVLHTQYTHNVQ